jgi:parallel beta-helix repeat protein
MRTLRLPTIALTALLALGASPAAASHVACGDVIVQDTTLDSDLVQCFEGLRIGADGVTLDLDGHTIDGLSVDGQGSNGLGIRSDGHSGVTIEDGTVQQFFRGVRVSGGSANTVRGITATQNENDAIFVSGADALVERNLAVANFDEHRGSGTGLAVVGERNRVAHNAAVDNVQGFVLGGQHHVIEHNRALGNRSAISGVSIGFWLSGLDLQVRHNRSSGNGLCGYRLEGARFEFTDNASADNFGETIAFQPRGQEICLLGLDDSRLERNSASNRVSGLNQGCSGLFLDRSDRNVITKNDLSDNDFGGNGSGMCLERSNDNVITKNRASRNGDDGIRIRIDSGGNVVERNVTDENGEDGIDTDSSTTTLTRNSADRNAELGIEAVPGVTDGGGNRAARNGNEAQCLNVSCG